MSSSRIALTLSVVNLALLAFLLTGPSTAARDDGQTLRGRALEIVDSAGRVRASIKVFPASMQKDGSWYPETTLLRMSTAEGRPGIKISTSDQSSLGVFGGEEGAYVQLGWERSGSFLKLLNKDGREQRFMP